MSFTLRLAAESKRSISASNVLECETAGSPALVDYGTPPPVIQLASWIEHWPPDLAAAEAAQVAAEKTTPVPARNGPRTHTAAAR